MVGVSTSSLMNLRMKGASSHRRKLSSYNSVSASDRSRTIIW